MIRWAPSGHYAVPSQLPVSRRQPHSPDTDPLHPQWTYLGATVGANSRHPAPSERRFNILQSLRAQVRRHVHASKPTQNPSSVGSTPAGGTYSIHTEPGLRIFASLDCVSHSEAAFATSSICSRGNVTLSVASPVRQWTWVVNWMIEQPAHQF